MPTITDANGNSRAYTTLEVNGTHLILDGWLAIDGPLSAYTLGPPERATPTVAPDPASTDQIAPTRAGEAQ